KKVLGARAYAAQHQQRPVPREGALYKLDWFKCRYVQNVDHYRLDGRSQVLLIQECFRFATMGPAGGESTSADHTALGVWALTPTRDLLLLHVVRERIALERIVPALLAVAAATTFSLTTASTAARSRGSSPCLLPNWRHRPAAVPLRVDPCVDGLR